MPRWDVITYSSLQTRGTFCIIHCFMVTDWNSQADLFTCSFGFGPRSVLSLTIKFDAKGACHLAICIKHHMTAKQEISITLIRLPIHHRFILPFTLLTCSQIEWQMIHNNVCILSALAAPINHGERRLITAELRFNSKGSFDRLDVPSLSICHWYPFMPESRKLAQEDAGISSRLPMVK